MDGGAWCAAVQRLQGVRHDLATEQQQQIKRYNSEIARQKRWIGEGM